MNENSIDNQPTKQEIKGLFQGYIADLDSQLTTLGPLTEAGSYAAKQRRGFWQPFLRDMRRVFAHLLEHIEAMEAPFPEDFNATVELVRLKIMEAISIENIKNSTADRPEQAQISQFRILIQTVMQRFGVEDFQITSELLDRDVPIKKTTPGYFGIALVRGLQSRKRAAAGKTKEARTIRNDTENSPESPKPTPQGKKTGKSGRSGPRRE